MNTSLDAKSSRARNRILASVAIDDAGCWRWQKSKSRNGYGAFAVGGGHSKRAHRVAFEVFVGPVPTGADVCHKCDVRDCVNPDHLFIGSRRDNIRDASRKNRLSRNHQRRGERHPASKLTEAAVREIRSRIQRGDTKTQIAKDFCISDSLVNLVGQRKAWAHVT